MKTIINSLLIAAGLVLAAACSNGENNPETEAMTQPDQSLMQVISGQVTYRERMLLPDGAVVKVVLEDQSRADAPATVITDYTHVVDGAPPFRFRLVYNPAAIKERMRYGLRARIENDGQLMFTSTEHIDPFASVPGTPVEITVTRVGR